MKELKVVTNGVQFSEKSVSFSFLALLNHSDGKKYNLSYTGVKEVKNSGTYYLPVKSIMITGLVWSKKIIS